MYGYKIKINSIPELFWACETTVKNYMWKNRNTKDMLEISLSNYKTKTVTLNGRDYILSKNDLSCMIADENRKAYCNANEEISIVSVAVKLKNFEYSACEFSEEDYADKSVILTPLFIEQPSISDELNLRKIMLKIIQTMPEKTESKKALFVSSFFELLYELDSITRKILLKSNQKNKSASNYYVKKIDHLIDKGFSKNISLQTIAAELNLSPVYLSTLYKQNTGITFSNKLNQVRMKHAENLLVNQNIPTAKIATLCGFYDDNYFRKQFKKFFGMNVKEYRILKNGMTLYHDKPVSENYKL